MKTRKAKNIPPRLTRESFRRAVKRAKNYRREIWKDEMEFLDRNLYGYTK